MSNLLNTLKLSMMFAVVSVPAHADHFLTLRNESSVTINELYVGDFVSSEDLLKGAPNEVIGGLASGDSTGINPAYHYEDSSCVTNLIVYHELDNVLVENIDICGEEIVLTDDDLVLDF